MVARAGPDWSERELQRIVHRLVERESRAVIGDRPDLARRDIHRAKRGHPVDVDHAVNSAAILRPEQCRVSRIGKRTQLVVGDTQTGEVRPLLTSTAWLAWPAISPAGNRVLFTEDRRDHDVVELSLSGGPPRVVVGSSMNDGSATWSPDGRRLAYVTDRRGPDEVWTRTGDGQSDQPLLTPGDFPGPAFGRIMSVRYSPDGRARLSLVTLASEPGGKFMTRLWAVPSHGGTPRPLLPDDAGTVRATWAPDGRSLAIRRGDGSIWAVNVDTTEPPRHGRLWRLRFSQALAEESRQRGRTGTASLPTRARASSRAALTVGPSMKRSVSSPARARFTRGAARDAHYAEVDEAVARAGTTGDPALEREIPDADIATAFAAAEPVQLVRRLGPGIR